MPNIQNNPKQAKQKILNCLKSNGGLVRCGIHGAHRYIYRLCYQGGNGSDHQDITSMRQYLFELVDSGEILMPQSPDGNYRLVALSSVDI